MKRKKYVQLENHANGQPYNLQILSMRKIKQCGELELHAICTTTDNNSFTYDGIALTSDKNVLAITDAYATISATFKGVTLEHKIKPMQPFIHLNNLQTPKQHRNKGYAAKLIEEIKQLYENIPIFLYANPMPNTIPKQQLINFYQKHGFEICWKMCNGNINHAVPMICKNNK